MVILVSIVLVIYGIFTLSQTPVDVFPDLNKPTVTIMTEAGGMASEEVEKLITFPLENNLNGLPNLQHVRSVSSAGLSFIYISFDWGVDILKARQLVSEKLSSMEDELPKGIMPKMGPISSIMGEIMQIAIPIDTSKTSAMAVREYADWVLRPRLMSVAGVAQVIPIGGEVRQFQVQPDSNKMSTLGVGYENIISSLNNYAKNSSGGFLSLNNKEYLIRYIGETSKLEDLKSIAVTGKNGQIIQLQQIANITFAPAIKRGDAGFEGKPAVILGIQKQPTADTISLTKDIEKALLSLNKSLPQGIELPRVTFRQASFIESAIHTLQGKLIAASIFVAVILFIFVGTIRTTVIALTAIPVSICTTILVFRYFGISINTMTLGGLAIAIGGLVDDAIVDVENIIRRLKLSKINDNNNQSKASKLAQILQIIRQASLEVRSSIVYATAIIILVFLPLFALPGIEGRLFIPLGIAFIVSTLASLFVSITITPVLSYYLLPSMNLNHGDTWLLAKLKKLYAKALPKVLNKPKLIIVTSLVAVISTISIIPFFPTTFLPPFNEGTLTISLKLNPDVTLETSTQIAKQAELLVKNIKEVTHVGRRSGRAELDEHAEGVHVSELDVGLIPSDKLTRSMAEINAEIRQKLSTLPVSVSIGQPISHRIDHMMSGVRSQIAIKIFGEDLDKLQSSAHALTEKLSTINGLGDIEIEKQVLAPQIKVRIDYSLASQYGVAPSQVMNILQGLTQGEKISQIIQDGKRFDLVLRLSEQQRTPQSLASLLIETPKGHIALSKIALIEDSDGFNQISRDNGKRRIIISANTNNRELSEVVADMRKVISSFEPQLPEGYFINIGGQFEAQEHASKLLSYLSIVAVVLMFMLLYSRYQSSILSLLIMSNIPLSLIGAVIGLKISGQPLSIAALIGFITLAGIAVRNDILKMSHYINLMRFEGEKFGHTLIIRASIERLSPVLMTALVTAFALAPLLFEAEQAGTEILHPVAVVIFSGLITSTLLDTFLTPAMFSLFGKKPALELVEKLKDNREEI
jgi:HME family heavy-metal exporter